MNDFNSGVLTDIIADFVHGEDTIDVALYNTNFAALVFGNTDGQLTVTVSQASEDLTASTTFMLVGYTNSSQLAAGDFTFV